MGFQHHYRSNAISGYFGNVFVQFCPMDVSRGNMRMDMWPLGKELKREIMQCQWRPCWLQDSSVFFFCFWCYLQLILDAKQHYAKPLRRCPN